MVLELVLRVSWFCVLLFSSGACFPVTTNDSGQTSSDESPSAEKVGTGPGPDSSTGQGVVPAGSPGGGVDPSPDGSSQIESSPGSSTGGWYLGAGSSTGARVDPGSSTRDWSFGVGGLTGGGAGPGSSMGSWSLGAVGSGAGSGVFGASGQTREVDPRWASSQHFPAVSSPFFHTWNWIPSRPFPDFSAWYTYEGPVSMVALPPQMPSSYVVQSGNGYQRGKDVLSHSKYSNNVFGYPPQSPVLPQYQRSVPVTGSQWTKVY